MMQWRVRWFATGGLLLALVAGAQTVRKPIEPSVQTERTFFLKNARTQADQNEVLTALRNIVSLECRIFLVPGVSAIAMEGPEDQLALAEKLLRDVDVPRKVYRLTYTVTETDSGKRIGVQHFAMVVAGGQRTQMKQGNRVPLVTGTLPVTGATSATMSTQVTYVDVGRWIRWRTAWACGPRWKFRALLGK